MKFPPIPFDADPKSAKYLRDMAVAIERELDTKYSPTTPLSSLLLVSPNGSVYTVAVQDDGTLITTLVSS